MAQALRPGTRETVAAPPDIGSRASHLLHPHHFRQRHHAAAILVVVVLAVVTFQVFPGRDVTVIEDGAAYRVSTTFDAPQDAIDAASVSLRPGDRVLSGSVGSYESVAVLRARPVVIEVDGRLMEVRTHAATVSGALAEAGIALDPSDRVMLDGHSATARSSLASAAFVSRRAQPVTYEVAALSPDAVRVSVVRARPVTVLVDTLRVELSSAEETVAGVLNDLGLTVREGDLVRPGLDTPVTAGMTVRLANARTVNLRFDGQDQVLYTQAATVEDVLAILGVDPGEDELLSPSRDTPITNGMSLVIGLTRTIDEVAEEVIQPPTAYETDPSLPAGQVRVVPGAPGLKQTTYRVTYKNGEQIARSPVGAPLVLRPAVATRHITGGKAAGGGRPTLNVPGYSGPYTRAITVRATWYNASHGVWAPGDPNYGRTFTGVMVDYGVCAVDPSVIPLGTRFYVPGYGTCVAADTGGLVRGNTVDLGFPEAAGESPWNTQTLDIYILD